MDDKKRRAKPGELTRNHRIFFQFFRTPPSDRWQRHDTQQTSSSTWQVIKLEEPARTSLSSLQKLRWVAFWSLKICFLFTKMRTSILDFDNSRWKIAATRAPPLGNLVDDVVINEPDNELESAQISHNENGMSSGKANRANLGRIQEFINMIWAGPRGRVALSLYFIVEILIKSHSDEVELNQTHQRGARTLDDAKSFLSFSPQTVLKAHCLCKRKLSLCSLSASTLQRRRRRQPSTHHHAVDYWMKMFCFTTFPR